MVSIRQSESEYTNHIIILSLIVLQEKFINRPTPTNLLLKSLNPRRTSFNCFFNNV